MSKNSGDGATPDGDSTASPNSKLTDKEARFAEEYLIDLNGAEAARRCGYADEYAPQIAYQLMRKPRVLNEIDRLKLERCERTRVTQDRVILELAKIGFGSLGDVASWDNQRGVVFFDSADIVPEALASISEVESVTSTATLGETQVVTVKLKIKRYDKVAALKELREHTKTQAGPVDAEDKPKLVINFAPKKAANE
jgi:phage terminase small subunit